MSTEKGKTLQLENTGKRDTLVTIEKKYQQIWKDEKVFELDAPSINEYDPEIPGENLREKNGKFFASMAYPYMNGILHVGHGFTLSKAEFATGFERMNFKDGEIPKRALFPLGFHCTGMPIKSAADKIAREVELFGKDFENYKEDEEEEVVSKPAAAGSANEDVSKFKAKKSKALQKQGAGKYQFQIMKQSGIPLDEIHKFADANYWLYYFPPLCNRDVSAFGSRVDWRRSMITTDVNPYYDSFIKWQINKLKELGKIKFGERYTIYSEKDGQACMDHDRKSGEGVGPQEYTGIKIKLDEDSEALTRVFKEHSFDTSDKKVYFIAATLRPETMYGQTCCFVSPKIDYGLFDAGNGDYYITTERAFKNMCYQKLTPKRGYHKALFFINGKDLIGSKITAPLAINKNLRILPMDTILPGKGTGVVTCVPSDSPDDYITMKDLSNKPEYYKIEKSWVDDVEIIPVIHTNKYGDLTAKTLIEQLKIQSPKDALQLAKAKEAAYKEGYFNGTMIIGKYKGEKVEAAKPKVRADLVASGEAFVYNEPESLVVSRSGDDCVVSLEDQWFIDYGEENWKQRALEALHLMRTFTPEVTNAFEGVLDWLKNWAVTRSYGLGTKLPWDDSLLVESLSDSTIYQAYYTVAHMLHSDYYGAEVGTLNIKPEEMTEDVWEYIFLRREDIKSSIPVEKLQAMRREFEFFYPLDISISGKDLIPNHLSFYIYTNVAIFPKKFWPAGIRANGHLLLNNCKMSKSTGNFFTLKQIVEKFGADASRIALADAGDSVEDANFEEQSASSAILRLFTLKEWSEDIVKRRSEFRTGEYNFFDVAFENEMNALIEECYQQYYDTNFKFALKAGLFDFQTCRDYYIDVCNISGKNMHVDLILRYIKTQALLLAPIAPHIAEYIILEVLGEKTTVHSTPFPRASKPFDASIAASIEYIRSLARSIREAEMAGLKLKKGKANLDITKPTTVKIYVSESFPEWQEKYIDLVRDLFEQQTLDDNKLIKSKVEGKDMKQAMPFISVLKQRLTKETPEQVFNRKLLFSELGLVKSTIDVIEKSTAKLPVQTVEIYSFKSGENVGKNVATGEEITLPKGKVIESAVPGIPGIILTQ